MKKLLAFAFMLAFTGSAMAADNTMLITPCAAGCVTPRSVDVGAGVQAPASVLVGTTGSAIYGTAGTANANVLSVQGIAAGTPLFIGGPAATGAALSGNPVRVGLSDGTNAQNWFTALAGLLGDGVNGNNTGAVAPWVWNGASWDRMPGTAANGIKAIVTNAGTFAVQATLAAETTKVIGTVNQGTSPWVVSNGGTFAVQAAQSGTWNITNISGTVSLPTGAATSANQTTELASLASIDTKVGSAIPTQATSVPIGGVSNDPCSYAAKTNLPISFQTTSITQQIALSGSTKIYVCSLSLIASAATVFSVTGGTGTNCGTPAALIGTTSATHGLSLAANGGMTLGNGAGTVAVTAAGSELCLVQSGAGDLVGNLTYVQQ